MRRRFGRHASLPRSVPKHSKRSSNQTKVGCRLGTLTVWLLGAAVATAFEFPTANRALLVPGQEEQFFVGTVGKPWPSGTFGCVRTDGWQMHEGLDIQCLERDRRGEPTDAVLATADGRVAYINAKAGLSVYGLYVVLWHSVEGLEIFSLYAHLREVRPGLRVGQTIQAGHPIGVMGRTANTQQTISRERAHLHFEVGLLLSDRYPEWHRKTYPQGVNDHGIWNGLNLVGLDPRVLLLGRQATGRSFSLLNFVRCQTELFRVVVRGTDFPWIKRYPALVQRNPVAERDGVAGYEIAFNFSGLPFHLVPRAASEIRGRGAVQLLAVNEAEYQLRPCRRLVSRNGNRWTLARNGELLISLLTF